MKSTMRITIAAASALVIALSGWFTSVPAQAAGGTHTWLVNATSPSATAQAAAAASKAGGRVVQSWPQIGVVVVRTTRSDFGRMLTAQRSVAVASFADAHGGQTVTDRLATSTVSAQSVPARTGTSAPVSGTDPLQSKQGWLSTIKATSAQRITGGSPAVVVAVLDTGVDDRHRDLAANFSRADSVDCTAGGRPNTATNAWRGTDSHGTHVAGTIAAARNGMGVTGVAPRVKVASIKVVDASGATYPEYLVCAYLWAAQRGVAVTNASINVFDYWCGLGIDRGGLLAVQRAVGYATKRGVTHVQSAGNSGEDDSWQLGGSCFDPLAGRSDVVQVGSVTAASRVSWFSSRGTKVVDVVALGENVYSDSIGGYASRTGTSQAAPQVSGALALMKSKRPSATPAQLIATLKATASGISAKTAGAGCRGTAKANSCTGAGRLDVLAAVRAV
ncbi:MAG TPA: S8 family serine peptidase [Candidatus Luteococcus avicola]|nr:S8 family serine peptidase [Candidatus Luteococcus avicola]